MKMEDERKQEEIEKEEGNEEKKQDDSSNLVHQKTWEPSFYIRTDKEIYYYAGEEITIRESLDSYGAVIWPAALALCHYLETNRGTVKLLDSSVLEIGAGTGLVSIVASLLGAKVTASDLPEVLGNLRCNLSRNTSWRCRYTPQVMELVWGYDLEQTLPCSVYHYDYVLAADVVYHHAYLAELLATMHHFCQPGTTLIWANKIRFGSDLVFVENFQRTFHTTLLADMGEVKIYSATAKDIEEETPFLAMLSDEREEEKEREEEEEEGDSEWEEGKDERNINVTDLNKQQNPTPNGADMKLQSSVNLEEQLETRMDQITNKELKAEFLMNENEREKQCTEQEFNEMAPSANHPLTEIDANQNQVETEHFEHGETEETRGQTDKECDDEQKESDEEEDESLTELEKEKKSESEIQRSWAPTSYYSPEREIHCFMGHKITIIESIDSYGGMIWPAAVALCKFLETPAGQEQISLLDKVTLELGAGTGLLSVAATLMGAKLTATDLPEILGNLQCNLKRNTRGFWRHEPQVAALSWGHELEQTFPHSEYHYDYVLAADVVYHHDYLAELLVTMQYFCQPGTNLVWANKVRYPSDLVFIENFTKAFHSTLIAEIDDVRIYLATHRDPDENDNSGHILNTESDIEISVKEENCEDVKKHLQETDDEVPVNKEDYVEEKDDENRSFGKEEKSEGMCETDATSTYDTKESSDCLQKNEQLTLRNIWEPSLYHRPDKEIHYFMGYKISIEESIDSYGAMIWPAAVALCQFLETPEGHQNINLLDKTVLEIGAGTGLVSVAATLLGARLTATDLPEILSNLRYNLNRNTRGLRRHEPQITELPWGHKLEENFPHSIYHYDYVLAADVVYHHDFLAELLVTMNYFCQPGTTLIWANKIRYPSDLVFVEDFKKTFHATLIAEVGDVRIYSATYKDNGKGNDREVISYIKKNNVVEQNKPNSGKAAFKHFSEEVKQKGEEKLDNYCLNEMTEGTEARKDSHNGVNLRKPHIEDIKAGEMQEESKMIKDGRYEDNISFQKQTSIIEQEGNKMKLAEETTDEDEGYEEETTDDETNCSCLQPRKKEQKDIDRTDTERYKNIYEERHFFAGHEIKITNCLEIFGTETKPGALALCKYLETNSQLINLKNKAVLELGAGSGLVSIVASLLGAWVTATDKPAVLDNLASNLSRNTRGFTKHTPQVEALPWNADLKHSFPRTTYRYDVVLVADVVHQHDILCELLDTMRHFCQPGTALIWADRPQTQAEISFTERFKRAFNATLIAEMGLVKIYMVKK